MFYNYHSSTDKMICLKARLRIFTEISCFVNQTSSIKLTDKGFYYKLEVKRCYGRFKNCHGASYIRRTVKCDVFKSYVVSK